MFHWVVLAVRWWNRMGAARVDALGTLACCAWVEDVKLACGGYTDCWAFRVLTALSRLGLLQADWRQQPLSWVQELRWQEVEVQRALARLLLARWQGSAHPNPRVAPSRRVALCTHMAWVLPLDPAREDLSRATAPPHTKVLGSFAVLRNYSQLRAGCAHVVIWIRRDPETSAGLFALLVSDCVAAGYSGRLRSCGLWRALVRASPVAHVPREQWQQFKRHRPSKRSCPKQWSVLEGHDVWPSGHRPHVGGQHVVIWIRRDLENIRTPAP